MGPFAMSNAEKSLQTRQTRARARCCIVTSKLLAQEIHADFCHHPFTQGAVASILPPASLHSLVLHRVLPFCLLRAVHGIAHRHTDGSALFFQQRPPQQECRDGRRSRRCRRASQALLLQELFDALLRPARCANVLDTSAGPVGRSSARSAGS